MKSITTKATYSVATTVLSLCLTCFGDHRPVKDVVGPAPSPATCSNNPKSIDSLPQLFFANLKGDKLELKSTFTFKDLQQLYVSGRVPPPPKPDGNTAYIFHVTSWTDGSSKAEGGVPVMQSSYWYVYRCGNDGRCAVKYTPPLNGTTPLLYNPKSANLISIEAFPTVPANTEKPIPATASLSYSISVTHQTPGNISSLTSVLTAILGAKAPTKAVGALAVEKPTRAVCVTQYSIDVTDLPYDIKFTVTDKTAAAKAAMDKAAAAIDKAAADQPATDKAIKAAIAAADAVKAAADKAAEDKAMKEAIAAADAVKAAVDKAAADQAAADQAMKATGTGNPDAVKAAVDQAVVDRATADTDMKAAMATGNPVTVKAAVDQAIKTAAAKAAPDAAAGNTASSFTQTFHALDREWWDLGIGMNTIPLRETVVTTANGKTTLSSVNRINPYGFFDVYPFFAKFPKNDLRAPHFQVGVPLSGQPLHRPYVGIGEPLPWIEQYLGFPVDVFGGVAFMRSQYSSTQNPHWVKKRMIGVELPVGQLLGKISGIKSK
jgi:hypothetical protein